MAETAMLEDNGAASAAPDRKILLLLALFWVALLVFHANKAIGLNPHIIPDEYTYIYDIRHRAYSEAMVSNYLYYAVYSLTGLFGRGFLDAGRILNAVFFMLSAPFIYMVSRMAVGRKTSIFIVFVALVSPYSSYTAYFMPESIYFTAFWIFAWLFLKNEELEHFRRGLLVGLLVGVMSLLKTHGVFLLPGFALHTFVATSRDGLKPYAKKIALAGIGSFLSFAAVRFGLSFVFAGSDGLSIFGRVYDMMGANNFAKLADPQNVAVFIGNFIYNLTGNAMALCTLTGLAVALALRCLRRPTAGGNAVQPRLALFTFSFLLPLALVSAAFCAMVSLDGPSEAERIQYRYYSFMLPMFFIITAASLPAPGVGLSARGSFSAKSLVCSLIILALGAYPAVTLFRGYTPHSMPDIPELGFLFSSPRLFYAVALLALAFHAAALFRPAVIRLYLFAFMPFCALSASYCAYLDTLLGAGPSRPGLFDGIADHAGKFAYEYLGRERADLTIASPAADLVLRALIHADHPEIDFIVERSGQLDMSKVWPGKKWVLSFGETFAVPEHLNKYSLSFKLPTVTPQVEQVMRATGRATLIPSFKLTRIVDIDYSADLGGGDNSWPVRSVKRIGREIVIDYAKPLPRRLSAVLEAPAWPGPPESAACTLLIGGIASKLPVSPAKRASVFADGSSSSLKIVLPDVPALRAGLPEQAGVSGFRLSLTSQDGK